MIESDSYIIASLVTLLMALTLWAAWKDFVARKHDKLSSFSAEAQRSEASMNSIYTVYGASIASCLVLINNTEAFAGNKVIIIIALFSCLTYLFFLNSWFRNAIFFPLKSRVGRD